MQLCGLLPSTGVVILPLKLTSPIFGVLLQALDMGNINTVVLLEELEEDTAVWCRRILRNTPMALRVLKAALNAAVRSSPQAGKHV